MMIGNQKAAILLNNNTNRMGECLGYSRRTQILNLLLGILDVSFLALTNFHLDDPSERSHMALP